MAVLLASFLQDEIAKQLSKYVENFDPSDIEIGATGRVQLSNVQLRKDCLDAFNLPIRLKAGMVGSLDLKLDVARVLFAVRGAAWRGRPPLPVPACAPRLALSRLTLARALASLVPSRRTSPCGW